MPLLLIRGRSLIDVELTDQSFSVPSGVRFFPWLVSYGTSELCFSVPGLARLRRINGRALFPQTHSNTARVDNQLAPDVFGRCGDIMSIRSRIEGHHGGGYFFRLRPAQRQATTVQSIVSTVVAAAIRMRTPSLSTVNRF